MSRFVNAVVVGVVALAVLAGVVFYIIQASDSAGGQDDRRSPSPTDETPEPSPTNETTPSP